MKCTLDIIQPDWPAGPGVKALSTTRTGGVSTGPFASLNLGLHVNDQDDAVATNRQLLRDQCGLPSEPKWLHQVHASEAVDAAMIRLDAITADSAFTRTRGVVCAVLTADCLPVLLTDRANNWVCAAHGGWRGLSRGVLENAIANYDGEPAELMAWLGPAIGPEKFEVGVDVYQEMKKLHPACRYAFLQSTEDKYLLDIYALARHILVNLGVLQVYGGDYCTVTDDQRFFSYRRDGVTGRMASLIWLT